MDRREFIKGAGVSLAAAFVAGQSALAAENVNGGNRMNILALTGSPRKDGNSNYLVEEFTRGATEKGHKVFRFDAAHSEVHPCIACNACGMDGPCVFNDDFNIAREHLIPADMVVFATPMYYFGPSAQLKSVVDRFYAANGQIHVPKKAALIMTYADTQNFKAVPIDSWYDTLVKYLGWESVGKVIAPGVWTEGAVKSTQYPKQAYELGRSI